MLFRSSNLVGAAATAKALELMRKSQYDHYESLYNYLMSQLRLRLKNRYFLNVYGGQPNIASINFSLMFSELNKRTPLAALLAPLGISCSSGSACDALLDLEDVPSHVLIAQKIPEDQILNTVRVSFTKYTTRKESVHLQRRFPQEGASR